MEILKKIFAIFLLILLIIIVMMYFRLLKSEVIRELFLSSLYLLEQEQDDFGAATTESIVQGDMKSEGGMSGLDNMDGTGTSEVGFQTYTTQAKPYPKPDEGKPDGSYADGPAGGLSKIDGSRDGGGSGQMGSSYENGVNLPIYPNSTIGVIPVNVPSIEEVSHGMNVYSEKPPSGEQGDVHAPFTYYYLEGENINKPCKSDNDCGTTKCSESGFCRY
jgi:hypothetical protein